MNDTSLTSRSSTFTSIEDTICALATAPGGALGIIRVSGPDAFSAVSSICSVSCGSVAANTVHYTHIVNSEGEMIDDVMVSIFRAPHSYTAEDSVEISCHGSQYILNRVLDLLMQNGCRMARPGEFTMRAYLNGKMDLSQAEAVADLIASTNRATHQMAMSQLKGHFSSELKKLRDQLLQLTSLLELELDFSDHEDLEFADRSELLALASKIDARILQLANSFETSQALRNGIPVAIIGKTNVGKSTLLNRLLGDDRAIVSDIHGTTRDTIEDTMEINGIQFRFIDTAGLRQTSDEIEKIGIERTLKKINDASIILWMLDAAPSDEECDEMLKMTKGKERIVIHNKADLIDMNTFCPYMLPMMMISAKRGDGIDRLKEFIYEAAQRLGLSGNEIIVTSARHYDALLRSHESILRVIEGMGAKMVNGQWTVVDESLSGDLLSEDLRITLDTLAEITGGQITPQDTLNNIFSHFCVGK